jgi:hypothetical protein
MDKLYFVLWACKSEDKMYSKIGNVLVKIVVFKEHKQNTGLSYADGVIHPQWYLQRT